MTEVKLKLLPDPDMYIFFDKGTRGRISYVSYICSKANNNFLNFYDKNQNKNQNILHT